METLLRPQCSCHCILKRDLRSCGQCNAHQGHLHYDNLFSLTCMKVMIAVDEALRRLEISAPERNATLEAFRYADARNAAALAGAIQAAQQEAAQAAQEADSARSQQAAPLLTTKPFTRWAACDAAIVCAVSRPFSKLCAQTQHSSHLSMHSSVLPLRSGMYSPE